MSGAIINKKYGVGITNQIRACNVVIYIVTDFYVKGTE
jgi:hypothetical protein